MSAQPDSVLLIVNPAAGTYTADMADAVRRRFAGTGRDVSLALTGHPGHAGKLAAQAREPGGPGLVVSLGGDGTAHEVVSGLAGEAAGPPGSLPDLLVLPSGTGNSFYREIWADRPWREALRLAATAPRTRAVDLARVAENGALALLGASTGVVAQSLITARDITRDGRDRYAQAVAASLRSFTPYPGRVTVDGEIVQEGPTVFANVGGGRYRGGRFELLPRSVMDDGLLDVCVVGDRLPLADLPALALDGGHVGREGVVYARGRRVVVERTDGRPLVFEYDGDLVDNPSSRFTLDVLPGALRVLAP